MQKIVHYLKIVALAPLVICMFGGYITFLMTGTIELISAFPVIKLILLILAIPILLLLLLFFTICYANIYQPVKLSDFSFGLIRKETFYVFCRICFVIFLVYNTLCLGVLLF